MYRIVRTRSEKTGLPPGTPVYVGEKKADEVKITIIDYDEKDFEMKETHSIDECIPYVDRQSTTWINVDGLHEVEAIERLGECFGLHALTVEDILNTDQRPKLDVYDEHLFIVFKMHIYDGESKDIDIEQVSLILGENFVLTFQEKAGDIFEPVRNRIKNNKGRIRRVTADYLAYVLMDALVDNYFNVLEKIGEDIEETEEELIERPSPETLQKIHFLKREMIFLRKSVWPLREIISGLEREGTAMIRESTRIYLRDLYDHTIQVIDTVETFRDMISGILDIYLSSVSNRMNEIMKVLTIFASIFIPLTFIAGIYGMNFNPDKSPLNMPELNWHFGYPAVLILMATIAIVLLVHFRRKSWL